MFLNGVATNMNLLYFSSFLQGFFTGTIEQIIFNLAGDFVENKFRVRAQITYTLLGLLYNPLIFLINELIHLVGWRASWKILGLSTISLGLLMLVTVKDPKQSLEISNDTDLEGDFENA